MAPPAASRQAAAASRTGGGGRAGRRMAGREGGACVHRTQRGGRVGSAGAWGRARGAGEGWCGSGCAVRIKWPARAGAGMAQKCGREGGLGGGRVGGWVGGWGARFVCWACLRPLGAEGIRCGGRAAGGRGAGRGAASVTQRAPARCLLRRPSAPGRVCRAPQAEHRARSSQLVTIKLLGCRARGPANQPVGGGRARVAGAARSAVPACQHDRLVRQANLSAEHLLDLRRGRDGGRTVGERRGQRSPPDRRCVLALPRRRPRQPRLGCRG